MPQEQPIQLELDEGGIYEIPTVQTVQGPAIFSRRITSSTCPDANGRNNSPGSDRASGSARTPRQTEQISWRRIVMVDITNPIFHDEAKAVAHLEASRWPDGPFCPYCGSINVHRMAGKTQAGMFLCNDCRDKFTARVGSVMERSHIPVHKWLLAMHLMAASKKGMSVQAAPAHARRQLQERMVSEHAHSRGHDADAKAPAPSAARARSSRATRRSSAARRRTSTRASPSPRSMPCMRWWSAAARCAPSTLPT